MTENNQSDGIPKTKLEQKLEKAFRKQFGELSLTAHELRELEIALDDVLNRIENGRYGDLGFPANVETLQDISKRVHQLLPEAEEPCDNTDCRGAMSKVSEVIMKDIFGGNRVKWCQDCIYMDQDMIKKVVD